MGHALIMEDNIIVGHAIQRQLSEIGFRSFNHAWSESQAIDYATHQRPSLIVIGDRVEKGSALAAARRIIRRFGPIPMVIASTLLPGTTLSQTELPNDLPIHGPCRLNDIMDLIKRRLPDLLRCSFSGRD